MDSGGVNDFLSLSIRYWCASRICLEPKSAGYFTVILLCITYIMGRVSKTRHYWAVTLHFGKCDSPVSISVNLRRNNLKNSPLIRADFNADSR